MRVNILLFPGFETLDAFGPVEILGQIPEYDLRYVSDRGGLIKSSQGVTVMTDAIDTAKGEILLIPGGRGTRSLVQNEIFLSWLKSIAQEATWCLTVCTGSALLARTGLLNGRRATSNKLAMDWVHSVNREVIWVKKARWVVDDKFYTSSGVSAGIDMALSFIADRFDMKTAQKIAAEVEYIWNNEPGKDPFAVV